MAAAEDTPTDREAQLRAKRRQLAEIVEQRLALVQREQALVLEISALEQKVIVAQEPPLEASAPKVCAQAAMEPSCRSTWTSPVVRIDEFAQSLAWLPSRVRPAAACEEVVQKYGAVRVTLFCGHDPASNMAERVLSILFKGSARVIFQVSRFDSSGNCNMEAVLGQQVVLICMHCSGDDGEADTIYGRSLSKKLHHAGKGWLATTGTIPSAFAVFGYGHMDPYVMLYRNTRGDSGLIGEGLDALGSQSLLKHLYVDEKCQDGIPAAAQQWSQAAAKKIEDWARGCWVQEEEVLKGPEWTFEEIMRYDFVVNRRGMQDG